MLASVAQAQSVNAGSIKIENVWSRMPPAASKVAGGFMTLTNTGKEPDRLIGGSAAIATTFELHEMTVLDGVMKMRQLTQGLEIKPGETVILKPGSYHVMFMDLTTPIQAGDRIKGTLIFEKAGKIDVEYTVGPMGAKEPGHDHGAAHGPGK